MVDYIFIGGPEFAAPVNSGIAYPFHRDLPPRGNGYLAGEYPDGITTVDGVPQPALIRVLYRPADGALGDGAVVASVVSAPDGTWRVDGLDPALRYDVIGRKDGFNDVIVSNVLPKVD